MPPPTARLSRAHGRLRPGAGRPDRAAPLTWRRRRSRRPRRCDEGAEAGWWTGEPTASPRRRVGDRGHGGLQRPKRASPSCARHLSRGTPVWLRPRPVRSEWDVDGMIAPVPRHVGRRGIRRRLRLAPRRCSRRSTASASPRQFGERAKTARRPAPDCFTGRRGEDPVETGRGPAPLLLNSSPDLVSSLADVRDRGRSGFAAEVSVAIRHSAERRPARHRAPRRRRAGRAPCTGTRPPRAGPCSSSRTA